MFGALAGVLIMFISQDVALFIVCFAAALLPGLSRRAGVPSPVGEILFGVLIGTYSSIYIASSLALALGVSREDLMPPEIEKEGEDLEPMP